MTARPKVQIVRPDVHDIEANAVEVYIDGKFILGASRAHHGHVSIEAIRSAARHVARALGADVEDAAEPDAQPYVYFIAYAYTKGKYIHGTGSVWHTRPTPIEDAASELASREAIQRDHPDFDEVVITNFICTDGPC